MTHFKAGDHIVFRKCPWRDSLLVISDMIDRRNIPWADFFANVIDYPALESAFSADLFRLADADEIRAKRRLRIRD